MRVLVYVDRFGAGIWGTGFRVGIYRVWGLVFGLKVYDLKEI